MLGIVKRLLGATASESSESRHERVTVATCALLLEMAHTDGELHDLEADLVRDLVANRFALSTEATDELLALARDERNESHDLYGFAREINARFTMDEKISLVEELWRIVYADGVLDRYEEHLMRQITTLLRLHHRQMIDAKLKILKENASD